MGGLEYGKWVQNLFTVAKTGASARADRGRGLCSAGTRTRCRGNFGALLGRPARRKPVAPGLTAATAFGLFVAVCVAQTGSLFSSDAWNNITFTAGEVREPRRTLPLALGLGTGARHRAVPAGQRRLPGHAAAGRRSSTHRATAWRRPRWNRSSPASASP